MNFARALRADRRSRIAFVGAGGKTSAMFHTARDLKSPVVVTTSTHLGEWQMELADKAILVERLEDINHAVLQVEGVTLISGLPAGDRRISGLDHQALELLYQKSLQLEFPIFIEADGARQKPIKAPGLHEPVIPKWVDQVVVCEGMSALGKRLSEDVVHRSNVFSQITGIQSGEIITPEGMADLLRHSQGGKKNIPFQSRTTALLNQVDNETQIPNILRVANLLKDQYSQIILSTIKGQMIWKTIEATAGIVLAAGGSARFGQPKILLDWHGKPLLRHTVENALKGGLSPVIVVLGAVVEPVANILENLPVQIIVNNDWQKGQSTSIRCGVAVLPKDAGSAVFLLADQPAVSSPLIEKLVERHYDTLAPVVAPRINGKRSSPVLFDRDTFTELKMLDGDTGGRAIMSKYNLEFVDWDDPLVLEDIDTPDDYLKMLRQTGNE